MHKKRVLLFSPPTKDGSRLIKDQYCSNTSKAGYYWIPVDLLVLSGDLAAHFEVKVLDAVLERKSKEQVKEEVSSFRPDHIVVLSSIISHHSDRELIRELREILKFTTTFIGDVFYFSPERMIEFPEVDSIIYEYPCPQLADYIKGDRPSANMMYKIGGEVVKLPKVEVGTVQYKTPRHDLFNIPRYSVPFMIEEKCTSVLTNFGCKFSCNYCPASSVTYRDRPLEDIVDEFKMLISQGIKNFWIRDFTFGLNKELTSQLLEKIKTLRINWFCLSRAETLNQELISKMKEAGCYLVMMGVDTINYQSMKLTRRNQNCENLKSRIDQIENEGMFVLGHMIIGLPGDTYRDMLRTIHFISFSRASFLSINLFAPRTGSAYFNEVDIHSTDNQKLDSYFGHQHSRTQRLIYLLIKNYGMLHFYGNPIRIFNVLKRVRTITQLKMILSTGLKIFLPFRRS